MMSLLRRCATILVGFFSIGISSQHYYKNNKLLFSPAILLVTIDINTLAIYFSITVAISSTVLDQEIKYFSTNNTTETKAASFIDHDTTSQTSIIFTIIMLGLSSCGIVTSCLLLYGLYRDCRFLLLPWIITIILFTAQDFVYIVYHFIVHALTLNPILAIVLTLDLFIISMNAYALLCVISQYQELKAGRGRALDDQNNRVPNIHYSSQPTATSYLSAKTRAITTYHETRPTPTQSPTGTGPQTSLAVDEASPSNFNKGPRKSVKFDHSSPPHNGAQLLEPWTIDVKSQMIIAKGADTAPLIEPNNTEPVLQSNL